MPRFCANLTFLFTELPFIERFAAAKKAGFDHVEILFPYDYPAQEIRAALVRYNLNLAMINTPPPNWAGGDRGYAAALNGERRFQYDFKRTLRYAALLKPDHIHIMAGRAKGAAALNAYVKNLKWAAGIAPQQSLLIEPINPTDTPGYFLHDFDQADEVLKSVGARNLALLFNAYHAHMITGEVAKTWFDHGALARHVQVAGIPDRSEPMKCGIDFPEFFKALDWGGYAGVVSGEYIPKGMTVDGLEWIE